MSIVLALTEPAAAYVCTNAAECANQGVGTFTATPARIWATVAAMVSMAGVIVGAVALRRSRRRVGHAGRRGAIVALAAGLTGAVNGALNLAVADGGIGTGNGVVGGAVALVAGLLGAGLGWWILASSHRTETVR